MPPSYLPARRRGAGLEFAEVAELILSSVSTQDTGLVNKWADANSVHRAGPLASLANLRHVLGGGLAGICRGSRETQRTRLSTLLPEMEKHQRPEEGRALVVLY